MRERQRWEWRQGQRGTEKGKGGGREEGRKEDVLEFNGRREGDIGGLELRSHHKVSPNNRAQMGTYVRRCRGSL